MKSNCCQVLLNWHFLQFRPKNYGQEVVAWVLLDVKYDTFLFVHPHLLTLLQLFRFKDRKDVGYLLSPTHEEEITSLVSGAVKSYKELPVRLYQICKSTGIFSL